MTFIADIPETELDELEIVTLGIVLEAIRCVDIDNNKMRA